MLARFGRERQEHAMQNAPPTIFSPARRIAVRRRMLRLQVPDAARFVIDDIVEDMIERLAFLRHEPKCSLVIGDASFQLNQHLDPSQASVMDADIVGYFDHLDIDLEQPLPHGPYDFIACVGLLDTVNDLPGALIHIRKALAPGGRAIASFIGAGSLPALRRIMLAADDERPAARIHPMVDVRAGALLLQRAGFADPVADSRSLSVAYRSLERLVADLRAQGLGNVLASRSPPLGKSGLERARAAFAEEADESGRVVERFEILTLSGRHP
jgi:SAM-dependent methyltransferase